MKMDGLEGLAGYGYEIFRFVFQPTALLTVGHITYIAVSSAVGILMW